MNPSFSNFKIQGHDTPIQFYEKMSRMSGSNPIMNDTQDVLMPDIEIEEVSPAKKEVPFFTKRGKLVIALLVVGSALYFIWQKSKVSAIQQKAEAPAPTQQAEAPTQVSATQETASTISNEQGTEGV
jgi:hypothetical protein